ncbi:hypothetical protein [Spirosoma lituiforme]
MSTVIKASERNVINFWFAEKTPIQQYKIKMNPRLWTACQEVSQVFKAPSGLLDQKLYRRGDKVAFARMVLAHLQTKEIALDQGMFELI